MMDAGSGDAEGYGESIQADDPVNTVQTSTRSADMEPPVQANR